MPKRTEDETQKGLIALAIFNGSPSEASKALADEGITFTPDQLARLKNTRPREYWEHREARLKVVRARMGEAAGRLADKRAAMTERILVRLEGVIDEMDTRDLVMALKALDSGYATSVKALGEMTGQPTARVEIKHTGEIVSRLQRIGVLEIDGEAEEIPQSKLGSGSESE